MLNCPPNMMKISYSSKEKVACRMFKMLVLLSAYITMTARASVVQNANIFSNELMLGC